MTPCIPYGRMQYSVEAPVEGRERPMPVHAQVLGETEDRCGRIGYAST